MNLDLENDDYFLCSWTDDKYPFGTEFAIHTKESLTEEYKDTGLLEDKGWATEFYRFHEFNVIQMMDYLIENPWLFRRFTLNNMMIMYIKTKQ